MTGKPRDWPICLAKVDLPAPGIPITKIRCASRRVMRLTQVACDVMKAHNINGKAHSAVSGHSKNDVRDALTGSKM